MFAFVAATTILPPSIADLLAWRSICGTAVGVHYGAVTRICAGRLFAGLV
jgi:hypothetical protein